MLKKILAGTAMAMALAAPAAHADTYTFSLNHLFSSSVLPGGPNPWATITVADIAANKVQIKMDVSSGLNAGEFVDEIYLNISAVPDSTWDLIPTGGQMAIASGLASNAHKADGDGFFDLLFVFQNANNDPDRFTAGETSVYELWATGVTASMFNVLSCTKPDCQNAGDQGPFIAVGHFQGLTGGASSWIGYNPAFPPTEVPIPAAAWLLGSGLLAMGAVGRRRMSALV